MSKKKQKDQKDSETSAYFQIQTVQKKNKKLSLTGYWILPDQISLETRSQSKSKSKKPKIKPIPIPKIPFPPKYILPPCLSELEKIMDGSRTDWCAILKAKAESMGIETIEHDEFYPK